MALRINHSTSGEVDALAITGMDVNWQGCEGLQVFERQIYRGMPVAQVAAPVPVSQAALRTAQQAWLDSGLGEGARPVAVLALVHGLAPGGANLASSIADALHLGGPAEELPGDEYSLADALQLAVQLLEEKQAEAVLLVEASQRSGAAALVLAPAGVSSKANIKPYATIEAVAECSPAFAEGIARTCQQALAEAGARPEEIGYLEIAGAGRGLLASEEMAGLIPAFQAAGSPLSCAVGELQSDLVLPGLVKVALCLSRRFLPGNASWQGPDPAQSWSGSPFFVPNETQAWFNPSFAPRRKAALSIHDAQDTYTHLILAEASQQMHGVRSPLSSHGFSLFLLSGSSLDELAEHIRAFSEAILVEPDLLQASQRMAAEAQAQPLNYYSLALVGHDASELQREAGFALRGVPTAFEKNCEWQTPLGSYFTPQPQGLLGKVAFVYPGAFTSSLGIGRDLFYLFPELHEHIRELTSDVGASIRERQLYPRSLDPLSKEELQAIDASMADDPIAMLTSGTSLGVVYTLILEKVFAIHPGAAFGYSLGENSLMYASGVWGSADQARELLEASPLFHTRLVGPQETIRQFWGLAPHSQGIAPQPLWANYLLMCQAHTVQAALADQPHVYLTHINTPRQVVIGGDPLACVKIINRLKCTHLKMPFNHAMHCPPVRAEFEDLRRLHDWPVKHKPDFPIYLSADCQPVEIDRAVVAEKIAAGLTSCVDFAGLTRRAYQDGARIFIELGAGSNCSKWIDDTLRTEPHLSAAINRAGSDDLISILRLLARLCSHRVPVDLSALFTAEIDRL